MLKTTKPLLQTISIDDKTAKQIYNIIDALWRKDKVYLVDNNNNVHFICMIMTYFYMIRVINKSTIIDLENPEHIKQFKAIGYYI